LVVSLSHHTIRGNDGNSEKERATIVRIEFILLGGFQKLLPCSFATAIGEATESVAAARALNRSSSPVAGLFGVIRP
jgi:hypothetical protein